MRKYCVKMLVNTSVFTALFSCILQKFALFKLFDPVCRKIMIFLFSADEARLGALRGQRCKKIVIFQSQGISGSTPVRLHQNNVIITKKTDFVKFLPLTGVWNGRKCGEDCTALPQEKRFYEARKRERKGSKPNPVKRRFDVVCPEFGRGAQRYKIKICRKGFPLRQTGVKNKTENEIEKRRRVYCQRTMRPSFRVLPRSMMRWLEEPRNCREISRSASS